MFDKKNILEVLKIPKKSNIEKKELINKESINRKVFAIKAKTGLSNIGLYASLLMVIIILIEALYFMNMKQDTSLKINELENQIAEANSAIETSKKVQKNSSTLTGKEKIDIEKAIKLDLVAAVGGRFDSVEIKEKIPVPGSDKVYYVVKVSYSVKDLDALKTMMALAYINPSIEKIIKIDNNAFEAVLSNNSEL